MGILTTFKSLSYQQIALWELFHKLKKFSTNVFDLLFKTTKVSIQKVISCGWVHIHKEN